MERSSDYWSTVAQILPVVMLALVVEGRAMARNLANKKSYPHNQSYRVAYSALFFINCVALFAAFQIALAGASGRPVLDPFRSIADLGLMLGVSTVFFSPVVMLSSTLASDWLTVRHRRMPYSKVARRVRESRSLGRKLDELRRAARNQRLHHSLEISRGYVAAYRLLRGSGNACGVHEMLDVLDQDRRDLAYLVAAIDREMAAAREKIGEVESQRQLGEDDLRALRSLVRTTALRT